MAFLVAAIAGFLVLPSGVGRDVTYDAIAVLCLLLAGWGIRRHRTGHPTGWMLVVSGVAAWVIGEFTFHLEQDVFDRTAYPSPSDAVYLVGYLLVAAGLLQMVRSRGGTARLALLLDATIVATGVGVVAAVFVIVPIAQDSTTDLAGKLVGSAYPVVDVLLLGIFVRLWASPGGRTGTFRLLSTALATWLVADAAWCLVLVLGKAANDVAWLDVLYLIGYLLFACGACSSSADHLAGPRPAGAEADHPRRSMLMLAAGLMLPGLTLLAAGLTTGLDGWAVMACGSMLLSLLVVVRMLELLGVVQTQAVQLAALAGHDALTGAPNRRSWDLALSRACQVTREHGEPLSVALLDLDHFKRYNDTYGHPAGDLVLREATATWSDLLHEPELLARYGGEEFAVLFPGQRPEDAALRLETMLRHTPRGQTFSAGVALWDPSADPATAVAAADGALYVAKRAGRARVQLTEGPPARPVLPEPAIVLQPIVDLRTAEVVGAEALSRFVGTDPMTAFRAAHQDGRGAQLEASALRAALVHRSATSLLSVNVGMQSLTSLEVRQGLEGDLTGVMIEITEHDQREPDEDLRLVVEALRQRGALVAVDDWGQGYSNLDRLLHLRPEVVKLDLSLVHSLNSSYHRAMVASITAWADTVGAQVCAEGIETDEQWHALQALGVHLGQGYLFGRPEAPAPVGGPAAEVRDPFAVASSS